MSEELLNEEVIVEEQGEIPAPLILEVDAALLVGEFLKDKDVSDEDSLNLELFLKGDLSGWRFKNVPAPTMEELKALESAVNSKLDQEKVNAEAQAFLDASDWMVVRAMEKGEELSAEFKAERQAARDKIVK
jgi:hypothetical protein